LFSKSSARGAGVVKKKGHRKKNEEKRRGGKTMISTGTENVNIVKRKDCSLKKGGHEKGINQRNAGRGKRSEKPGQGKKTKGNSGYVLWVSSPGFKFREARRTRLEGSEKSDGETETKKQAGSAGGEGG